MKICYENLQRMNEEIVFEKLMITRQLEKKRNKQIQKKKNKKKNKKEKKN